jgi:hypothetical protein
MNEFRQNLVSQTNTYFLRKILNVRDSIITDVADGYVAFVFRAERISELGTTLAIATRLLRFEWECM